jgi:uncharacterized protein YecT (DUF1311 family)
MARPWIQRIYAPSPKLGSITEAANWAYSGRYAHSALAEMLMRWVGDAALGKTGLSGWPRIRARRPCLAVSKQLTPAERPRPMHKLSRGLSVVALALFVASPIEAAEIAYSDEYQACTSQASSTAQMRACTNEELARWIVRLDAAYRSIEAERGAPTKAKSELAQAQQSWTTFRRQACIAEGDLAAGGGTAAPAVAAECALVLTARRAADLERLSQSEQRVRP